ncbi:hypothetical protein TWF694_008090 [Orbilia ellipsospora]|uniref:Uncharacterized protein n=1 Tax=Orbilia ellipsospora TaxID=2528407 RepID=A0AAV9XF27_9PEZI
MKAFSTLAVVAALVCPALSSPTPFPPLGRSLEKRVSYEIYSWVNTGCPGAASSTYFKANVCTPLPGASTKLATPDGSCYTYFYKNPGCGGSILAPAYNVCYDTRTYNSVKVIC